MNKSHPLISFAIPAYNHASYIRLCLDKIALEPYPNKELLIIDDGSTDDTAAVIRNWIDQKSPSFPVDFTSRPNRGTSATLNELIAKYRGDYLKLCSSDDYLMPGTAEKLMQALVDNPTKKVAFGDAIVIDTQGNQTNNSVIFNFYRGRKKNYFTDAGLREEIVYRWSLAGPLHMVKRGFFEEIGGYDESLKIEDWDFMLQAAAKNQLVFIDVPVAAYRTHATNTFKTLQTTRSQLDNSREYLRVIEKHCLLFKGKLRREMLYRAHKHRAMISVLEKGEALSTRTMRQIRLNSSVLSVVDFIRGN